MSCWQLRNDPTNLVADLLNGSSAGTISSGTTSFVSGGPAGRQALSVINGGNVSYGDVPGANTPTSHTYAVRFKWKATSPVIFEDIVIAYGSSINDVWSYRRAGTSNQLQLLVNRASGGLFATSPAGAAPGIDIWRSLVTTVSGTTWKTYFDGALVDTSTITTPVSTTGGSLRIGRDPRTGRSLNGELSDFIAYPGVWSDAQVADWHADSEPTNTGGSVTATVAGKVLSIAADTTTWNSYSNGTVTALYTFQYRPTPGDAWIGLDTETSATSYDFTSEGVSSGSELRILRHAVNNGGFDAAQNTTSNVVTYVGRAHNPLRSPFLSSPLINAGL